MRKKILFCALVIMLSLTGCGVTRLAKTVYDVATGKTEYITPDKEADILSEQVLESVLNQDKEQLKSLFCKKLQEKSGLDEELEEFFNFMDGEIVSHDEPDGSLGFGRRTPEDGYIIDGVRGNIKNIKTDAGKTYEINYTGYRIYKSDESLLGITGIRVLDLDEFEKEKDLLEGYYYDIDL